MSALEHRSLRLLGGPRGALALVFCCVVLAVLVWALHGGGPPGLPVGELGPLGRLETRGGGAQGLVKAGQTEAPVPAATSETTLTKQPVDLPEPAPSISSLENKARPRAAPTPVPAPSQPEGTGSQKISSKEETPGLAVDIPGAEPSERLEEVVEKAEPELPGNDPDTGTDVNSIRFYGSVRLRLEDHFGDENRADLKSSRFGFRGRLGVTRDVVFSAQAEANFRPTDDDVFVRRLLYAGLESSLGRLYYGKQSAAYYDVSVFTDQMPILGGDANGTFNAGTDGSLSGTGRASQSLQYRNVFDPVRFTVQCQIRNTGGPNNRRLVDTWGWSLLFQHASGVDLGVALSQVFDGVPEPDADQAKEEDAAYVVGARYSAAPVYVAFTHSWLKKHEKDDLDRFFTGRGLELHADYEFSKAWRVRGAYYWQQPEASHPGSYGLNFALFALNYRRSDWLTAHLLYRLDGSRASDGSSLRGDVLALSVYLNF